MTLVAPLAARDLARHDRAVLLDVRSPAEFARGHAAGALSVPFSTRGLAPRARTVLPEGLPVVLVASDAGALAAASTQLGEAGIEVLGALEGGFGAWRAAGLRQRTIAEVSVRDLASRPTGATVVDVREPLEWTTGYVPGARLIPLGALPDRLDEIPRDRRVVVICEAGIRSCAGASILARAGYADVAHVPGGSSEYRRAGLPLAFPPAEVGAA